MSAPTQIEEWVSPLSHLATGESMAALILVPAPFTFIPPGEHRPLQERAEVITTLPDGLVCRLPAYYPSRQGLNAATLSSSFGKEMEEGIGLATRRSLVTPAISGISEKAWEISGLSRWLDTVNHLPWSGLPLAGSEHEAIPSWRNPAPLFSEEEPIEDDDDEPAFMAYGEFLE